MLLKEFFPLVLTSQQLSESYSPDNGGAMIIKGVLLQKANAKNRNGRIYPKDILKREIDKYNTSFVMNNRALGELDHFDTSTVNLKNVSHNIKKIWWDNDDVRGDVEILDGPEFPSGRIAAGLLRRGIPVGISSRALGSTEQIDENTVKVNDDLALSCFDLVSYESTINANMSLNEGYNQNNINKYKNLDDIIHEIICNNSNVCSCMFDKK
jgi:hypothetical protein